MGLAALNPAWTQWRTPLAWGSALFFVLTLILGVISIRQAVRAAHAGPPGPPTIATAPSSLAKLRLVFTTGGPTASTHVHPLPPEHGIGRGGSLYRVGIHNESHDVTARNASLWLVSSVEGATGLPARLSQMHDTTDPPLRGVDIGPRQLAYFDVVSIPFSLHGRIMEQLGTWDHHMYVHFADPVYQWMPVQKCALRLEARADNALTSGQGELRIGAPRTEGDELRYDVAYFVLASTIEP